jgi:hypothetical protein
MAEAEVQEKLPNIYESVCRTPELKNWDQIRDDLLSLNWLDINIQSIAPLIANVFTLLDSYTLCDLSHQPRTKLLKLNTVKMFLNTAFYNFASYRNEIKDASAECKKRISDLQFFVKAKESLELAEEEALPGTFKEVVRVFEEMKSLAKSVTLHLKSSFQADHNKEIEDYIDEQFFKQVLKEVKSKVKDVSECAETFYRFDRNYASVYTPHYSNYPSQVWPTYTARENIYFGELNEAGLREGYGEITYSNSDVYKGSWVNDKPEGRGVYLWKDSGRYEGDFLAGKIHGQGKRVYHSGNVYIGSFVDGKKKGNGIMKYSNGDEYNGEWDDDYLHGRGTYTWAQGDNFVGKFVKDKREGKGTLTMSSGEVLEAEWVGGKIRAGQA